VTTVLTILWRSMLQQPRAFAINLIFQLGRTLLALVPPLFVQRVFALFEAGTTSGLLVWLCILAVFVSGALRAVVVLAALFYEGLCKGMVVATLTRSAVRRTLQQPGAAPLRKPLGDVLNRLSVDTLQLAQRAAMATQVLAAGVQAALALTLMLVTDALMTLAVVPPVLLAAGVVWLSRSRAARLAEHERNSAGIVSQMIHDCIKGAATIQQTGARRRMIARLRTVCESRRSHTARSQLFSEVLVTSTMTNIATVGVGLMLLIAAVRADRGVSVGDLTFFMAYLVIVVYFVATIGGQLVVYEVAGVAGVRLEDAVPGTIRDMPDAAKALPEPAADPAPIRDVVVRGLTYTYPGTGHGVRDVSFDVRAGELIAVVGHVGSGKSTLVRALLGLLERDPHMVLVNGEPCAALRPPQVGYSSQRPALIDGTLRENVLSGVDDEPVRTDDAIRTAALDQDVDRWPMGMDTTVGPGGRALSGGQLQRASAARMIVREPELYVVDELSSALDQATEQEMWSRLLDGEVACIAVTQRLWLVERADRVLVLNHGAVEAFGPLGEILAVAPTLLDLFPDLRPEDANG
jgi:ATP-binding cassette, subfamily B, bacterial